MTKLAKIGRPPILDENKRQTICVRIDPELLEEVKRMPNLSLTQAVENGLKLVLAHKALNFMR
jgi:hypothetical protein